MFSLESFCAEWKSIKILAICHYAVGDQQLCLSMWLWEFWVGLIMLLLYCWWTSASSVHVEEIEVIRKLSEDQCSGSELSDITTDESAHATADHLQLTVLHVSRRSGHEQEPGQEPRQSEQPRESNLAPHESTQPQESSQVPQHFTQQRESGQIPRQSSQPHKSSLGPRKSAQSRESRHFSRHSGQARQSHKVYYLFFLPTYDPSSKWPLKAAAFHHYSYKDGEFWSLCF